jgi:cell division protein FtsQ
LPAESRLTFDRVRRNKRRSTPVRERLPELRRVPGRFADACGRAVRRAVPLLAVLGIGGAVAGAGWAGWHYVTTSPRFAVTAIEIRGAHTLSDETIRAHIPVELGDNVFLVDRDAVEAALEREPWIADAEVRRRLPQTIEIEVRERVAAAIVEIGGIYLADADGRIFKRARVEDGEGKDLPVVTGITREEVAGDPAGAAERVRRALEALTRWKDGARPNVGEIRVDSRHGVTLYTFDDAIAIRLGDAAGDELARRLRRFDAAWASLSPEEKRRAHSIHLDQDTRPDHVTVGFTP